MKPCGGHILTRFLPVLIIGLLSPSGGGFAANIPQFQEIVRNPDGSVRKMAISSMLVFKIRPKGELGALEYCDSQGQHLPSAREWAQFSTAAIFKGIIEVAQYKNESGYHLVEVKNIDGKVDKFYFNYEGLKRTGLYRNNDWFWTSSVDPDDPSVFIDFYGDFGFVFNEIEGNHVSFTAVRCAAGRLSRTP